MTRASSENSKNYNIDEQKKLIANIPTLEKCERFMANVMRLKIEELVAVVNRRMVEIRTELSSHEIVSQHERDMDHLEIIDQLKVCLAAYEQTLKNKYAGRIRPQIAENGFIDTVDSLVQKRTRSDGFIKLRDLGLEEFLFEQVIVENPEAFSEDAVAMSKERLCVQC
jgi:hypothetical protein